MNVQQTTKKSTTLYSQQRQQLLAPIDGYLQQYAASSSCLLLDGTGPRLTMQLPYLAGLGIDTLQSFQQIHAFSGGIAAYLVYLAQSLGALRYDLEYYFSGADKQARRAHRQPLLHYPKLLGNLLQKRPIYDKLHYMEFFQAILSHEFLDAPIDTVAPNFIPYIAHPEQFSPLAISIENSAKSSADNKFDRSQLSVYDVMAMSLKIPDFYTSSENTVLNLAYDATYTGGYFSLRNKLAASFDSAVVLSLFPRGLPKQACVIDLAEGRRVKPYLLYDMVTLVLNIPNRRYKHDLQLAYL